MAIEFEFFESPAPTDEGKKKYHARTVINRTVTTTEVCRIIQGASSLTVGDVRAVLSALNDIIASNLESSNRVHLEGIGFFEPTLKTSREVVPGKTRAQSVWFKAVSFRADKILKNRLKGALTARAERKSHSLPLTNEQVNTRVWNYFKSNDTLTTKGLRSLCGFTKYTAIKHMKRLVEEGKIKNIHTKKNPVYVKS